MPSYRVDICDSAGKIVSVGHVTADSDERALQKAIGLYRGIAGAQKVRVRLSGRLVGEYPKAEG
jgi:hypothetical protein